MRIGILADVHESVGRLRQALGHLHEHGVDRLVALGDIFELGHRLDESVGLLRAAGAVGVWGNHDFGLCHGPPVDTAGRYDEDTLRFMRTLEPRLEIEGCLFTHVEPWLDPHKIEDLWWFGGFPDTPERADQSFRAVPHRVMFFGHLHRWLLATPGSVLTWRGARPIRLDPERRWLVAVHAVCEGQAALYDTETGWLHPLDLRGSSSA
jgi:hypothetical protein